MLVLVFLWKFTLYEASGSPTCSFGICRLQYKVGITFTITSSQASVSTSNMRSKAFVFANANANLSKPNLSNRIIGSLQALATKLATSSFHQRQAGLLFHQCRLLSDCHPQLPGTSSTSTNSRLPTLQQYQRTFLPSSSLSPKRHTILLPSQFPSFLLKSSLTITLSDPPHKLDTQRLSTVFQEQER